MLAILMQGIVFLINQHGDWDLTHTTVPHRASVASGDQQYFGLFWTRWGSETLQERLSNAPETLQNARLAVYMSNGHGVVEHYYCVCECAWQYYF